MKQSAAQRFDPEVLEIVKNMVLFDDDLMKVVLKTMSWLRSLY